MAIYYGKEGESGNGLAVGTPGNLRDMVEGTGAWTGTIGPSDTILACPGVVTSTGHVAQRSSGGTAGAPNWLTIQVAAPGVFPGENGTELEFVLGSSYNHRYLCRAFTRWVIPDGSELVITKSSGDGLGYWQAVGPVRVEGTIRFRTGNLTNLGSRYINLADEQNGSLCWYDTVIIEHGRNSNAGPGVVLRDAGNHVRVHKLIVNLSTDVTTERYSTGLIRCGSQSSFDFGNLLEIDRVEVQGAAAETDHLVEAGAAVRVGSCDLGLMKPHHDVTLTVNNDFGAAGYEIGVDGQFKQHAGSGQGRVDGALSSPPTLQGNDPKGVGVTYGLFPTTVANQIHEFRPLRFEIEELAEHTTAAVREVSVELLTNPTFDAAVDTRSVWAEVTYLPDGASAPVTETTRADEGAEAALAASAAAWSSTTYLTQNLTKRKLSLTTSQAVTAQTKVMVRVYVAVAAASTSDFILVSGRTLVEV